LGVAVGAAVGVGVGIGVAVAATTAMEVEASVESPTVAVTFVELVPRAETTCDPAFVLEGTLSETENDPLPFARKATPVKELSSAMTPLVFFAKPEPRTVMELPGAVLVGEATRVVDAAPVIVGASAPPKSSAVAPIATTQFRLGRLPRDGSCIASE
jgi:hypothetical protein